MTTISGVESWADELGAWNVAIERSRYEYDKKTGGYYDAHVWPMFQVRAFYQNAINHPERHVPAATLSTRQPPRVCGQPTPCRQLRQDH